VRVGRSIHFSGSRKEKPFIAINCASIPEELLESELFGHEKGAFPGAVTQKKGKIEAADGGTLFLNEIGDLSQRSQDRLLEILQEQSFERIGGNRKVRVDIRLIAATKREPAVEVSSGKLREDLFYRLNVLSLKVPSLKDRRDDIPELVRYFSVAFNKREGGIAKKFTQEALQLLTRYEWPGNVRELKNIVERIQIMSSGSVISAADIPLLSPVGEPAQVPQRRADDYPLSSTLRQAREEFERDFIISKLEENDWNISRTAELIELERSNLHRKIKSFGIDVRK
jgi:two-component system nitrogen regulation response regulator NtrX